MSSFDSRPRRWRPILALAIGGVAAGGAVALLALGTGTAVVERVVPLPPPPAVVPLPAGTGLPPPYRIQGFRSASFGMTEDEVRAAVVRDFGLGAGQLAVEDLVGAGTRTLSLRVDGLAEGAGPAQLVYMLGWRSRRLIQVSLIWGPDAPTPLDRIGETLKRSLAALPFDPAGVARDQVRPDGIRVLFRAGDRDGHAVTLMRGRDPGGALHLAYLKDEREPDMFRLTRRDF